jgi:hypothetical protein
VWYVNNETTLCPETIHTRTGSNFTIPRTGTYSINVNFISNTSGTDATYKPTLSMRTTGSNRLLGLGHYQWQEPSGIGSLTLTVSRYFVAGDVFHFFICSDVNAYVLATGALSIIEQKYIPTL